MFPEPQHRSTDQGRVHRLNYESLGLYARATLTDRFIYAEIRQPLVPTRVRGWHRRRPNASPEKQKGPKVLALRVAARPQGDREQRL